MVVLSVVEGCCAITRIPVRSEGAGNLVSRCSFFFVSLFQQMTISLVANRHILNFK